MNNCFCYRSRKTFSLPLHKSSSSKTTNPFLFVSMFTKLFLTSVLFKHTCIQQDLKFSRDYFFAISIEKFISCSRSKSGFIDCLLLISILFLYLQCPFLAFKGDQMKNQLSSIKQTRPLTPLPLCGSILMTLLIFNWLADTEL